VQKIVIVASGWLKMIEVVVRNTVVVAYFPACK